MGYLCTKCICVADTVIPWLKNVVMLSSRNHTSIEHSQQRAQNTDGPLMTRASRTANEVQPDYPEWDSLYLMLQRKRKQNKIVTREISASSGQVCEGENYCCLQIRCLMSWVLARHLWSVFNVRARVHLDCCQMVHIRNLLQSKKHNHWVFFLFPSCCTIPLDLWTMQRYESADQHWGIPLWTCIFLHSLATKSNCDPQTASCAVYQKILLKSGSRTCSEAQPYGIDDPKS